MNSSSSAAQKKTKKQKQKQPSSSAVDDEKMRPLWEDDEEEDAPEGNHRHHRREGHTNNNNTNHNDNTDDHRLTVNRRVAHDYQTRKEREELLQHRRRTATERTDDRGDSEDSHSSSEDDEDEDGHLLTAHLDVQVLRTINAIRNRDTAIYDPNQRFFDDDDDDDNDDGGKEDEEGEDEEEQSGRRDKGRADPTVKKTKPKRYKDVVREQLLRQVQRRDALGDDDTDENPLDDDSDNNEERQRRPSSTSAPLRLAYDSQQQGLRKAFLEAATDALEDPSSDNDPSKSRQSRTTARDDEHWLTVKRRSDAAADGDDNDDDKGSSSAAALRQFDQEMRRLESSVRQQGGRNTHNTSTTTNNGPIPATLVDPKGEVADGEAFLLQYFKDRKWMDPNREDDDSSSSDGEGGDESGDEEHSDSDGANPMDDDHINNDGDDDDDDDGEVGADDDDASLHDLDQADEFEAKYNFRFEEGGSGASGGGAATGTAVETATAATASGADASLIRYSRGHELPTYRRPDTTRQERRQARKERKAAERQAQEEQLRRLKNAKRRELEGQLRQVKAVLGEIARNHDNDQGGTARETGGELGPSLSSSSAIDEAAILKLLEGDFDPDKFEQLMQEAYGDQFYNQPDATWKSDQDVRTTLLNAEEEDGALLVGHDDADGGLYDNEQDADEEEDGDYGEHGHDGYYEKEDEEWPEELEEEEFDQGNDAKTTTDLERKVKSKLMDELYKLDYEDIVAGQPTRFKYRKVPPNNFGLSAEEILLARDSTLKKFVSLKQIAPYRDDEYFVGSRKRRRFREWLQHDLEEEAEKEPTNGKSLPHESTVAGEGDDAAMLADPSNAMEGDAVESKKKKKNRRLKKNKKRLDSDLDAAVEEPQRLEAAADDNTDTKHSSRMSATAKVPRDSASPTKAESQRPSGEEGMDFGSTKEPSSTAILMPTTEGGAKEGVRLHKKKKAKKKKKTKNGSTTKPVVEGVSEARLTSYGL